MSARDKQGGKGGRKYGRNSAFCLAYRSQNRRFINKVKRIKRHIKRNPNDIHAASNLRSVEDRERNAMMQAYA